MRCLVVSQTLPQHRSLAVSATLGAIRAGDEFTDGNETGLALALLHTHTLRKRQREQEDEEASKVQKEKAFKKDWEVYYTAAVLLSLVAMGSS